MKHVPCCLATIALLALAGCGETTGPPRPMILATTTSTRDSGLLDVLVPMFRESTGIEVRVVAVGTGQALAMGRRGDADGLLTHDPEGESEFVAQGHSPARTEVFSGDFLLVGPPDDPGRVGFETSA